MTAASEKVNNTANTITSPCLNLRDLVVFMTNFLSMSINSIARCGNYSEFTFSTREVLHYICETISEVFYEKC